MNLKLLKRQNLYSGKIFNVIVDEIEYPSGRKSIREVVDHPGGALAVPVFSDRRILLVHQHRYPFNKFVWECPAGKLNVGEDPQQAAQRELEEETGYRAKRWVKLSAIYPTPGFCNEIDHLYLATELVPMPGGHRREEGEQTMTSRMFEFNEVLSMIDRQEIIDAKTICAILLTEKKLNSNYLS